MVPEFIMERIDTSPRIASETLILYLKMLMINFIYNFINRNLYLLSNIYQHITLTYLICKKYISLQNFCFLGYVNYISYY